MERTRRAKTVDEPCASGRARRSSLAARLVPALGALLLAGCPGGGNDPAPSTHVISGTISGPGAAGATVVLSGAASDSVQADETGWYAFGGLRDGDYAVTPSRTGSTFTPASRPVTLAGDSVAGQDFTAAAVGGHAIAGKISGADAAGVTVTLSGAAALTASTTTGDDGTYRFEGYPDGDYTVSPSKLGDVFSPADRSVTLAAADVTGADFSVAVAGATATVDRVEPAASAAIGGSGVSTNVVLTNWTASGLGDIAVQAWIEQGEARRRAIWVTVAGTCAPASVPGVFLPGTCTFGFWVYASNTNPGTGTLAPGSATLAVELVKGAASTVLHALRVPITLVASRSISGRISGSTGVSLSALAAADGRTWGLYTGGADTYSMTGLPAGGFTITPSKSGYQFSPASRLVDVSAADATGVDFSAAPQGATLTLDRVDVPSPTAVLGGTSVAYTAILTNWTAGALASIGVDNWIEQGSARRAAFGTLVSAPCSASNGQLPPGTCAFPFSFGVSNAYAGTGTLVPGSATLAVELDRNGTVVQTIRVPITLATP